MTDDNLQPAVPLDLAAIEARLANCTGPWDLKQEDQEGVFIAMATQSGRWTILADKDGTQGDLDLIENAPSDLKALVQEVKRLRGNIEILIKQWSFYSPHSRDTLKTKDVLAALHGALISENYYAGED